MTKGSAFVQYCKSTLNLPKTSFPMHRPKGMSNYESLLKPNTRCPDHPEKVLLDGPPFANGQLHIGHALNKILKDMIARSSTKPVYWTPGWDCHGLPIELKARANHQQQQENSLLLRQTCEKYASDAIRKQKSTMQSWALTCDYSAHYKTMDPQYEANGLRILAKMIRKGLVYSALRPVYWSPSSRTALAEAEVEYAEMPCTTAYVRFSVGKNTFMLAWTTTPWTLFGNRALAISPQIEYVQVTHESSKYMLSKQCAMQLFPDAHLEEVKSLPNQYFFGGEKPILTADWVNAEVGTGIVHLAPAHGLDDYLLCKQNGIEIDDTLINEDAKFTSGPLIDRGIFEKETEVSILDHMKEHIFRTKQITHSYPIDWRTKQPLVFRATRQWFLKTNTLNNFVEKALENVTFVPPSAKETLIKTIKGRKSDWCISRQRIWGLPIPVFLNKATKEPLLDPEVVEQFADMVEKNGTNVWYELEPKDFGLSNDAFERDEDTLDVWFESGTAWSTLPPNPLNAGDVIIVEGSDQFRGWFQSLLLTWLASQDHPKPVYTTLVKHGFVLDAQGKKMSKSLGNVIDPQDVCEKYGVDTLRLWVACSAYTTDITIGPETLNKCAEKLQKFRNTFRFILGNQTQVNHQIHQLRPLDEAALNTLVAVNEKVQALYAEYKFDEVVKALHEFVTEDLSGFYFDLIKDRLYVTAAESLERKSAQIALSIIGDKLCLMLTPILPFLCAEYTKHRLADSQAVNLTFDLQLNDLKRIKTKLLNEAEEVAKLRFFIPKEAVVINETDLRELLKCAHVQITSLGNEIKKEIVNDHKCVRCWSFRAPSAEDVCPECSEIVDYEKLKKITI